MDIYGYLRAKVKDVTYEAADAHEVEEEIEHRYQIGDISGTDYDSLMALLSDWL